MKKSKAFAVIRKKMHILGDVILYIMQYVVFFRLGFMYVNPTKYERIFVFCLKGVYA